MSWIDAPVAPTDALVAPTDALVSSVLDVVLTHGYGGEVPTAGFPDTGTWLIFGVILVPVYVMIAAWFLGTPSRTRSAVLGLGYLVGITVGLWLSMFVATELVSLVFF